MSELVAVLKDNKWQFYNRKLEEFEPENLDDYTVYAILPDDFFFFFQTDITAKRHIRNTVWAYANSNLPVGDNYIGYIKRTSPVIGYVFFKDKLNDDIKYVIEKASTVTTFFNMYSILHSSEFIYVGDTVSASFADGKLEYFLKGNEGAVLERLDSPEQYEIIHREVDEKDVEKFFDIIDKKSLLEIELSIENDESKGVVEKNIAKIVMVAAAVLLVVIGGVFRYEGYKQELFSANTALSNLYEKALGNKKYNDPYGMLLYKAYKGKSNGGSFSPLRLLYTLSRAKGKRNIKIDYIVYSENSGLEIKGEIDNYADLVDFVKTLNGKLHYTLNIKNTFFKNKRLKFSIGGDQGNES